MNTNHLYINRCIKISKPGIRNAMPNPSVGAVVVFNDTIIGEGFTNPYGGNHAEVNAINSVKDKSLLSKSTLYVSLEPCNHFGKTPPCTDLIIQSGIQNIVIGCLDSNEKVAGIGINKLTAAGINVILDVLKDECRLSNKRHFTFHEKKRPYIILKWAETQNGFIAPSNRKDKQIVWITNEISRQLSHKWRTEEQAILIGTQTVIDDNPQLTARDWAGKNPTRIVLDQNNKLPKSYAVFNNHAPTIVISKNEINFHKNVALEICDFLFKKDIQSVIIEGGRQTLQTFIDANIWDEARVFKSPIYFESGINAPILKAKWLEKTSILDDDLFIYKNSNSLI